ncbi:MAG: D-glycero-beta-D-manno-heptose-7-phosphate kinase [Candidatus Latescibacterota bacterium]|nr:MAG: D-glycero-beta-D-manno-heptose-7-phosphate kinase [Candidatus Latescibacterota bacterium]
MTQPSQALREALEKGRGIRILVIGDIMLDEYIWGSVDRVSPEAPVQVVEWQSHHDGLGGAANVAQNLVALGCEAWLAGIVGSDDKGERLLQLLSELRVHADDVLQDAMRPTTSKLRVMAHAQQMLRIDREVKQRIGDETEQRLVERLTARIPEVDGVVCSDYGKGVLTREVLAAARRAAQRAGKLILADPKGTDYTRYLGFDFVTPNRKELEAAAQMPTRSDEEIVRAGQKVLGEIRGSGLLVTRGKDGMTLLRQEKPPLHVPASAREVYDVTGAGDTVLSAFAMALFGGAEAEVAAELANLAAGVEVGRLGAAPIGSAEVLQALEGTPVYDGQRIVSRSDIPKVVSRARGQSKRIVFTNGCFDILHVGHIKLLQKARSLGDLLIVGINDDASVRSLKGEKRPLIAELERAHVLASLDCVDYVTIFSEDTPLALIDLIRPDVLVKGGDYAIHEVVGRSLVESYGGRVELVPIVEGFSTSDLVRRIVEKYNGD